MAQIDITNGRHFSTIAQNIGTITSPLYACYDANGSELLLTDDLPKALATEATRIDAYEEGKRAETYAGPALAALRDLKNGRAA